MIIQFYPHYIWVIDQACSVKDGWILAKLFFCMFMNQDGVEVHKHAKKEQGQYPAILTEQAWSIKDVLHQWLSGKFFLQDAAGSPERAR